MDPRENFTKNLTNLLLIILGKLHKIHYHDDYILFIIFFLEKYNFFEIVYLNFSKYKHFQFLYLLNFQILQT
jgi:hypothetical protein